MISDARTIISAARLTVLYTLKHAGGYDPNTVGIMVACGIVGSFDPEEPGSGGGFPDAEFEEECAMNCFNSTDDLKSQIKFENDVLEAGKSYICSVAAQNMEGTFYYTTSPIIATTGIRIYHHINVVKCMQTACARFIPTFCNAGIPMKPTLSVVNGSRSINLTVSSPFPGVPLNDPSFVFEINVTDSANDTVYSSTFNGTFIDRDISIGLPAGGIYTVEVYSQNKYGISDTAVAVVLANVQTTDPPTLEDNSSKYTWQLYNQLEFYILVHL